MCAHCAAVGTSASTPSDDEKAASWERFCPMAACESSAEPASITSRPTSCGAHGSVRAGGAASPPCAAGGAVAPSCTKEAPTSGTPFTIGTAGGAGIAAASAASLRCSSSSACILRRSFSMRTSFEKVRRHMSLFASVWSHLCALWTEGPPARALSSIPKMCGHCVLEGAVFSRGGIGSCTVTCFVFMLPRSVA